MYISIMISKTNIPDDGLGGRESHKNPIEFAVEYFLTNYSRS